MAIPFLVLSGLTALNGILQLVALQPLLKPEPQKSQCTTLLIDPYILLTAFAILIIETGCAVIDNSLSIWMIDTMNTAHWQNGAVHFAAGVATLLGIAIVGPLVHKIGHWLAAMMGLFVASISFATISYMTQYTHLLAPMCVWGFAKGTVYISLIPMFANLADLRHTSAYGCVYAIASISQCLSFSYQLLYDVYADIIAYVGFTYLMLGIAIVTILYSPLMWVLKAPKGRQENLSVHWTKQGNPESGRLQNNPKLLEVTRKLLDKERNLQT